MSFNSIINFVEAVQFGAFYYIVSNQNKKCRIISLLIYVILHFILIQIINQKSVTAGYYAFLFYLVAFAVLSFSSDYSAERKAWLAMLPDLMTAVINLYLFIFSSFIIFHKIDYSLLMEQYKISIIIISKITQCILFFIISREYVNNPLTITRKEEYIIIVMCLTCITAFNSIDALMFYAFYNGNRLAIAILCLGLFSLCMLWIMHQISCRNQCLAEEQEKNMMLNYELKIAQTSLQSQEKLRQSRHDLLHILELVKKDANTNSKDSNTIYQCERMLNDAVLPIETCSPLLNYIINLEREKAESYGNHLICCFNITDDSDFVSNEDLTVLVTNLLDNAIGHNIVGGDIRVNIKANNNFWIIKITNPVSEAEISEFEEYLSQGQRNNHGFGLTAIDKVAKKYNGKTNFLITDNYFVARVVLFSC